LVPIAAKAQNLLINGSLEMPLGNDGGRDTVPPGWTMEEGPRVPEQPGPYVGDYNNSGVTVVPCPVGAGCGAVDAADYTVWRNHLGQSFNLPNRSPLLGGAINDFDYDIWKEEFGEPDALSLAEPANFEHLAHPTGDLWHMWFQPYYGSNAEAEDNFAHLTQVVAGTPGMLYTMKGWALFEDYFPGGVINLNLADLDGTPTGAPFDDGPLSPTDTFFALEFLDSGGAILDLEEIELKAAGQPSNTTWTEHALSAVAPAGTTNVRVRASMLDGVENPLPEPEVFQMSFFVDVFSLTAEPAPGFGHGVPEPASWVLVAIAVGTMGALRRRPGVHV
jgi:hypothetical protein